VLNERIGELPWTIISGYYDTFMREIINVILLMLYVINVLDVIYIILMSH